MRRWSTRTRRVTFLPPPPLPARPTSFAPSPAVQHIVNNSHTFPPCHPRAQLKTREKHAALQRCGSRDIDAEYWGACLLLRLRMRGGGRRCGANAPPQHRGCDHVMHPACFKPACCAFCDLNCICSFQEQVSQAGPSEPPPLRLTGSWTPDCGWGATTLASRACVLHLWQSQ